MSESGFSLRDGRYDTLLPSDNEEDYGSASTSVNRSVSGHAPERDRIARGAIFLRDAMYCRSPGYLSTPEPNRRRLQAIWRSLAGAYVAAAGSTTTPSALPFAHGRAHRAACTRHCTAQPRAARTPSRLLLSAQQRRQGPHDQQSTQAFE